MPWSSSARSTSTSRACARSWVMRPTSLRPSAASAIDSMSRGWWSLDPGVHRRDAGAGLRFRPQTLGDELGADDRDLARGLDPQADLAPLQADDGHADVVADKKLLHQLPGQHQHGTVPLGVGILVPFPFPDMGVRARGRSGLLKTVGYIFPARAVRRIFQVGIRPF